MLILGTLIVTWIVRNWWKLLLLLVAIIVMQEYMIRKNRKNAEKQDDAAADAGEAEALRDDTEGTEAGSTATGNGDKE